MTFHTWKKTVILTEKVEIEYNIIIYLKPRRYLNLQNNMICEYMNYKKSIITQGNILFFP